MKYDELDWVIITDRKNGHNFKIGEKVMIMEKRLTDYVATNGSQEYNIQDDEIKLYEA